MSVEAERERAAQVVEALAARQLIAELRGMPDVYAWRAYFCLARAAEAIREGLSVEAAIEFFESKRRNA